MEFHNPIFSGVKVGLSTTRGSFIAADVVAGNNITANRIYRGADRYYNNTSQVNNNSTRSATSPLTNRVYEETMKNAANKNAAGGIESKFFNIQGLGD